MLGNPKISAICDFEYEGGSAYHAPMNLQDPYPAVRHTDDGRGLFTPEEPLTLDSGARLAGLTLAWETWGELNADRSNAVLVHHALSVSSHAASTRDNPENGWWENMIGPGKALDSDKYFIICINNPGSCFGSSGPLGINPSTGDQWRYDFPQVTITDMVRAQKILTDHLGIKRFAAIVGSSMGGMLSLAWAAEYPDNLEKLVLISSCMKAYPANVANRSIQQEAIRMDPAWKDGNYLDNRALAGFRLARKMGLYSYRNSTEWNRKFEGNKASEIVEYVEYNAGKFSEYFDANSYLVLTTAMDLYDMAHGFDSPAESLARVKAKTLVVSVDSDVLFTPAQQQELYDTLQVAGVDCEWISHESDYGHDAFLVETEPFTNYITGFLEGRG